MPDAVYEKLAALEEKVETRFKSVEINVASGFASLNARLDQSNGIVAKLNVAEVRRDEREKVEARMLDRIQTTTRWYLVSAIGITGLVVGALEKLLS